MDIATVNTAISIKVNNNNIEETHVAIGGVAAIPKYLKKTSDYLTRKPLNSANIIQAQMILQGEISPISDVRGSSEYKRLLARQLFFAHFIELFESEINIDELLTNE